MADYDTEARFECNANIMTADLEFSGAMLTSKPGPDDWKTLATKLAKIQHDDNFSVRWGVFMLDVTDKLCIFNNNPYSAGKQFRDNELSMFRELLERIGIQELGFGEAEDGYTFSMILNCGDEQAAFVSEAWEHIILRTQKQIRDAQP